MAVEFDTASPIWLQLIDEFHRRLVTGDWAPGARLPGVRELAADLGVNPNTVQRALSELERDELCRTERAFGRFATDDEELLSSLRRRVAARAADEFISRARGFGMTMTEAGALLEERWAHDNDDKPAPAAAGG